MARSKAKRVAARQTQLGQRKKKQNRASTNTSRIAKVQVEPAIKNDGIVESKPAPVPTAQLRNTDSKLLQTPASKTTKPTAQNYVKNEIKRISLTSATVIVILVVLTVALR